ncbi:chorismate mutase [Lentzea sp. NPDC004782]|uniref:chorismate mutase n=1 Tax=Lentzea sp. NPDC004782 TaxID=3154458 RepID=UPI00339DEAA0
MTETVEVASTTERDVNESMINDLQQQIDKTDAEIIQLIRMRADLSKRIGTARQTTGCPKFAYSRELALLARYRPLGEAGVQLGLLLLRLERGILAQP